MKKKSKHKKIIQAPDSIIADIQGALIDVAPKNNFENIINSYENTLESQQEQSKKSEGLIVIKKRFIDNMAMLKKADNFIHRKHFGKAAPLFIAYLLVFVLSMAFLVINESNHLLMLVIALIIGAGCLVNIYYMKKFNRVNNAIEFQNYIFANAMRSDNEFCLIFNEDGDTVYTDPRLQKLIVSEESKTVGEVDLLLLSFEVAPEKVQAIKDIIFRKKEDIDEDAVTPGNLSSLTFKSGNAKKGMFLISVMQLEHPVGYTTLKMTKIIEEKGI